MATYQGEFVHGSANHKNNLTMRSDTKLERNLEICKRFFNKEKTKPELARLYGVTRERIVIVVQRKEEWERQAKEKGLI